METIALILASFALFVTSSLPSIIGTIEVDYDQIQKSKSWAKAFSLPMIFWCGLLAVKLAFQGILIFFVTFSIVALIEIFSFDFKRMFTF